MSGGVRAFNVTIHYQLTEHQEDLGGVIQILESDPYFITDYYPRNVYLQYSGINGNKHN